METELILTIPTEEIKKSDKGILSLVENALLDPGSLRNQEFDINILIGYLLNKGYTDNASLLNFAKIRIEEIVSTITSYGYNIYVPIEKFTSVPKAFREKCMVNPELTGKSLVKLPLIYDIQYIHQIGKLLPEYREKIDKIINYIIHDTYQSFPNGYGIMQNEKRKYYSIGWSLKLPFYGENQNTDETIFYALLFSPFKAVHSSPWFEAFIQRISAYMNQDGLLHFPSTWIREKSNKYFIGGNHLGIIDNRRAKNRMVFESTYWYEKIMFNIAHAI